MVNNDGTTQIPGFDKEGNPKLTKDGRQLMVTTGRDKIMIQDFQDKIRKEEQDLIDR